jgi:FKBP-type peptidyl-prolyl cis-trans isomerase
VDRVGGTGERLPKTGDQVSFAYRGSYLNGRFLERSGSDFELIYGTPEQILTGLNYAIGRLKLGENAKIILPSRLAFGDEGSSNGTVPPFTPLVYQIQLTKLKTKENAR